MTLFYLVLNQRSKLRSPSGAKVFPSEMHLRGTYLVSTAPQEIAGHTSPIRKALWCNDDKQILSAAEDKTIRSVKRRLLDEQKMSLELYIEIFLDPAVNKR